MSLCLVGLLGACGSAVDSDFATSQGADSDFDSPVEKTSVFQGYALGNPLAPNNQDMLQIVPTDPLAQQALSQVLGPQYLAAGPSSINFNNFNISSLSYYEFKLNQLIAKVTFQPKAGVGPYYNCVLNTHKLINPSGLTPGVYNGDLPYTYLRSADEVGTNLMFSNPSAVNFVFSLEMLCNTTGSEPSVHIDTWERNRVYQAGFLRYEADLSGEKPDFTRGIWSLTNPGIDWDGILITGTGMNLITKVEMNGKTGPAINIDPTTSDATNLSLYWNASDPKITGLNVGATKNTLIFYDNRDNPVEQIQVTGHDETFLGSRIFDPPDVGEEYCLGIFSAADFTGNCPTSTNASNFYGKCVTVSAGFDPAHNFLTFLTLQNDAPSSNVYAPSSIVMMLFKDDDHDGTWDLSESGIVHTLTQKNGRLNEARFGFGLAQTLATWGCSAPIVVPMYDLKAGSNTLEAQYATGSPPVKGGAFGITHP